MHLKFNEINISCVYDVPKYLFVRFFFIYFLFFFLCFDCDPYFSGMR
jgi:hypothetical protein